MARQAQELQVVLKVEYIPIPAERVGAWRAGVLLLLQLIRERRDLRAAEEQNERVDSDRNGNAGRVRAALLSLAAGAARQRSAEGSGIYAWYVGHNGSAYRVALGAR